MLQRDPNYKVTVLPLCFKNLRDLELENLLILYDLESLGFVKNKKVSCLCFQRSLEPSHLFIRQRCRAPTVFSAVLKDIVRTQGPTRKRGPATNIKDREDVLCTEMMGSKRRE